MSLDMQEGRKPSAAPAHPVSALLRTGRTLTSCRCRRLTVSPHRLPQSRRRSLLLRTTGIWMRPRKSWNSLTRPSLPQKKPMRRTMPMRGQAEPAKADTSQYGR